ncbi:TPA: recombination protein RecR [Candidatus Poribacteria bacterium]|nr:recombination protein RecR [Candidatus Poribacteria bacterium]
MQSYPEPLAKLINELRKLPGVGPKTSQRFAFYMLKMPEEDTKALGQAIFKIKSSLIYCQICGNITEENPCHICQDLNRDHSVICVVEEPDDLLAIERTRQYNGVYHVLMGALSPLEGVNPQDLRLKELFERVNSEEISEIILATNHTTEGQATALYIAKRLEGLDIKLTRIAYGIPVGGDLEYTDEVTLGKALEGRREFE